MRIVYIGAERVGLACLQRLVEKGKNVVGVVTADEGLREKIADFIPFDPYVAKLNVPFFKVRSSRAPEVVNQVASLAPDLIIVISWSQIIPPEILHCAPRGCIGIHYSLLPGRRGGAPLNWALIDGLTMSGMTLFYYDEGIDTGDIIAQETFAIDREDTVKTLLDKIVIQAPDLLDRNVDLIEQGTAPRMKQDERMASYTKPRKPADGVIDWSKSNEQVYNFIRALAPPYPCAFTWVGAKKLIIPRARLENGRLWIEGYME